MGTAALRLAGKPAAQDKLPFGQRGWRGTLGKAQICKVRTIRMFPSTILRMVPLPVPRRNFMNLAAIILAAGKASRFGGDKLSASFSGEPLLAHAIRAARAGPVSRVILVCPPSFDTSLWPDIETVRIASPQMSASLKAGIAAAAGADGAFIFLGDMPLVPHSIAAGLAGALGDKFAAVPRWQGRSGHPVLLSARAFPLITALTGDEGAGRLLKARKDVAFVDCADEGVLLDIDHAEDIARLERH
jgi:molybdenum cofactor cytidylyltransferase